MFKHLIISFLFVATLSSIVSGQNDPVLFTVEGVPVHVSEFDYIYSKSKIDTASYSKASLEEYLELYKNFKLKVRRAKEMQLDTIPSLQKELDVKIAEQKLMKIQKDLKQGKKFADLAKTSSDDKNTSPNGGSMGFLTALFPDGFYNLETAAYTTPVGKVSPIVRTVAGMHLVTVNSTRPARGQMEIAHILVRLPKGGDEAAVKAKIESIHQQLKGGADFATLAKEVSEDAKTAKKGGYVGFIGVRHPFEDTAFALANNNDFSEPMKSSIGWHIVKRINKKPVDAFEIAKRRIQTRMQENQKKSKFPKYNRLNNARNSMISRIKREGNYKANRAVLNTFISSLDSSFVTYKWKAPRKDSPKDQLFTLGAKGEYVASKSIQNSNL